MKQLSYDSGQEGMRIKTQKLKTSVSENRTAKVIVYNFRFLSMQYKVPCFMALLIRA